MPCFMQMMSENAFDYLLSNGIVVRNRSNDPLLENTIRITIGSESEMNALKEALNAWNG